MASANNLTIGYAPFLTTALPGTVRSLKYYPARIADAQLRLLTQ